MDVFPGLATAGNEERERERERAFNRMPSIGEFVDRLSTKGKGRESLKIEWPLIESLLIDFRLRKGKSAFYNMNYNLGLYCNTFLLAFTSFSCPSNLKLTTFKLTPIVSTYLSILEWPSIRNYRRTVRHKHNVLASSNLRPRRHPMGRRNLQVSPRIHRRLPKQSSISPISNEDVPSKYL